MDQIKIGKFIAERRTELHLTQKQLATQLNITDRAVSKWETGKSLPDASIMLDLCQILKITVNDLLSGEVITMDNYKEKTDAILIKMVREQEEKDKMLFKAGMFGGTLSTIPLFCASLFIIGNPQLNDWVETLIVCVTMIPVIMAVPMVFKIQQKAGYFKCPECGHCHIPTLSEVVNSRNSFTKRELMCPNCKKKTWQKKVFTKD